MDANTIVGVGILFCMGLVLIRAIKGPTVIDRIVAVNVIGTKTTVLIVLMGLMFHRMDMFVDIALGYALLNFITSVAAAKYFKKQIQSEKEESA